MRGQVAGETPDGVNRWIGPQKGVKVSFTQKTADGFYITGDGAKVR